MVAGYELICAVRDGKLQRAKEIIDTVGLFYAKEWAEGYVLLLEAIENKHTEIAKLLLLNGARVNSKQTPLYNKKTKTALHLAANNGNVEIVKMLLDRSAIVNVRDEMDRMPLYYAVKENQVECVALLLNYGAHVNVIGNEGIHTAIKRRRLTIVNTLSIHGSCIRFRKNYTPLYYVVDTKASKGITPLHIAAENGNLQIVEDLLNHGANINSQINCERTSTEKVGYTPLHFASAKGSAEVVELLLSKGADVNANGKGSVMPLSVAIQNGHETIVKLLLEHGADVDAQDKDGNSILYLVVKRGHLELVEHILNFRPDVNNRSNRSSLHTAIQSSGDRYGKVVESLLNYGFTITSDDINNCTLLFASVEKGYLKIVEDLLQSGADINMISNGNFNKGDTLLHIAIKKQQEDMVKLLINYRADINAKNASGMTPILSALEGLDLKFVKLLLNNGADIRNCPPYLLRNAVMKECIEIVDIILQHESDIDNNGSDITGQTLLHYVLQLHPRAEEGVSINIAKLLLNKGANVNSRTWHGTTPLHAAVEVSFEKLVEMLLEYNAGVNSPDTSGTMPIHTSAKIGNVAIMKMLINKMADINAKDKQGYSALHFATERNHHEKLVNILLKCGADYDSRTENNMTPLHLAAYNGLLKNVLNLLRFGADIDATDEFGNTALQIACKERHSDIVLVLLENGADINIMNEIGFSPLYLDDLYYLCDDYEYLEYYAAYEGFSDGYSFNYDDHETRNREKNEIANIFVQHIVKLKAQNLFVNEDYSRSISKYRDLGNLYTSCESEVIDMRSEKIGNTNVTIFDILTKHINRLTMYTRNEDILHVLESQVYQEKFPRYANMIHNRFCKAQERQRLLNLSVKRFNLLFGYEFPQLFTNQMFHFLSIKDLENLIEAYDMKDDDQLTSLQDV